MAYFPDFVVRLFAQAVVPAKTWNLFTEAYFLKIPAVGSGEFHKPLIPAGR